MLLVNNILNKEVYFVMSVHKNQRNVSSLEFYVKASQLRTMVIRFMMNEKRIPKRYRFVFTMPTIDIMHKMMHNIVAANTIYPTNEAELAERKRLQTAAIASIEEFYQMLQCIIEVLPENLESFKRVLDIANEEIKLIKAWKKSSKIMKRKSQDVQNDD